MTGHQDLQNLERRTYRDFYSDGIIDIYVGISLLGIGVAWIWLPDIAGLAGVLPAIFITPMLTGRKRFLENRIGYVKWTEPRRQWEHRNLVGALIVGTAFLLLGVGVYMFASDSDCRQGHSGQSGTRIDCLVAGSGGDRSGFPDVRKADACIRHGSHRRRNLDSSRERQPRLATPGSWNRDHGHGHRNVDPLHP